MADYTSTVELVLNGLEKLRQAEDRIKRLDGKNVKIKFDVDSSGIKKVQDMYFREWVFLAWTQCGVATNG